MQIRALQNLFSCRLHALPMVILYITDKCSSRCICCDYWRTGQREMSLELVEQLKREFARLGTRFVLLSGGEPLQHPRWEDIAASFKASGSRVAMATSGLLLPKHADAVLKHLDEIYISLDGATPESYKSVRGVDGFGQIRKGVAEIAGKLPITFRTTVQRANYRELSALVRLTKSWGATHHSFLPVDVHAVAAFGRSGAIDRSTALLAEDLGPFAAVLEEMTQESGEGIATGYISESKEKLLLLHRYFSAILGLSEFPAVNCNAPRFSAVIETDGSVKPCFFLPASGRPNGNLVQETLNSQEGIELRREQGRGRREECKRCVCPLYKGPWELLGGL